VLVCIQILTSVRRTTADVAHTPTASIQKEASTASAKEAFTEMDSTARLRQVCVLAHVLPPVECFFRC